MNAEVIVAVAVPTGVVVGWLTKHFQAQHRNGNSKSNATAIHQTRVEGLLANIEKHTSEIPLLTQAMRQHEEATQHARGQVAALAADMEQRQRRGE